MLRQDHDISIPRVSCKIKSWTNLHIDQSIINHVVDKVRELKDVPNDQKKQYAQDLNEKKTAYTQAIDERKEILQKEALNKQLEAERIDVTKFSWSEDIGATHPVMDTMNQIIEYFQNLNFAVEV